MSSAPPAPGDAPITAASAADKTAVAEAAHAVTTLSGPAEPEDRLPEKPVQWLGLLATAAFVGAAAGLVGAAFRFTLFHADILRNKMLAFSHTHVPAPMGWAIPVALCGAGGGVGLWLTQRFSPRTAGSGIPRVEAVLRAHLRPAEGYILPVKFAGGALSIASGMALGREGPTVQMGGTIGRIMGGLFARVIPEPWTLIAAGAGAGLAVAFNAPLAAALFVMEELIHRFSTRVFSATLIACIAGTLVLRAMGGRLTDFTVQHLGPASAKVLPEYLLLGLAAGILGVAFNVMLVKSLQLFDRARHWPRGAKGALVGAAAGLLAWFSPMAVGGGEILANYAAVDHLLWGALAAFLILRFALTMASYGSGAPGGIFAPLLALGALLGNMFAAAGGYLTHATVAPGPYAIVAMAALFTAVVRSPLTGVVLLLEMTGGWTLILPMMAASLTAYIVPELLGIPPIYDSLRERDEQLERAERGSSADTGARPLAHS